MLYQFFIILLNLSYISHVGLSICLFSMHAFDFDPKLKIEVQILDEGRRMSYGGWKPSPLYSERLPPPTETSVSTGNAKKQERET